MLANRNKAQLIADIAAESKTPAVQNMVSLIELVINERRHDNDTAEGNGLYRNQGEIRGLKDLGDYIVQGLPTTEKIKSMKM